ncbi:hypothetical protein B0T13DRAFT_442470 [Neurospora crassa]|nr:hypothetical protein B0T13DRAFT_442470 [Neurospora crassa]
MIVEAADEKEIVDVDEVFERYPVKLEGALHAFRGLRALRTQNANRPEAQWPIAIENQKATLASAMTNKDLHRPLAVARSFAHSCSVEIFRRGTTENCPEG